jgi:hypothetical protein
LSKPSIAFFPMPGFHSPKYLVLICKAAIKTTAVSL